MGKKSWDLLRDSAAPQDDKTVRAAAREAQIARHLPLAAQMLDTVGAFFRIRNWDWNKQPDQPCRLLLDDADVFPNAPRDIEYTVEVQPLTLRMQICAAYTFGCSDPTLRYPLLLFLSSLNASNGAGYFTLDPESGALSARQTVISGSAQLSPAACQAVEDCFTMARKACEPLRWLSCAVAPRDLREKQEFYYEIYRCLSVELMSEDERHRSESALRRIFSVIYRSDEPHCP